MSAFADSFWGKFLLIVLDKIVIGAIIAVAFVCYELYRTKESRNYEETRIEAQREYEERRAEIQLDFERARLLKEFLPIIHDPQTIPITSSYLLRSAIRTNSLDGDAAFSIGSDFLYGKLSDVRYKEFVSETLPGSINALASRGVEIAKEWQSVLGSFPNLDVRFNPLNGEENFLEGSASFIKEARFLRDIMYENLSMFDNFQSTELAKEDKIRDSLFGLFVLLQTTDLQRARELSHKPDDILSLVGMIVRLWRSMGNDEEAEVNLEAQFNAIGNSADQFQRAKVLVALFRWITASEGGLRSPAFVKILGRIAVGELPSGSIGGVDEGDIYWLRWNAAEALHLAEDNVATAAPLIMQFLESFQTNVVQADSQEKLREISNQYQSGKILRLLVSVLASVGTDEAKQLLQTLFQMQDGIFAHFPFLKEDLRRALD